MRTTEKLANLTLRGLSHALLQLPITRFRNDIDLPNGRTYRANWEDPDCHIKCRNGVPWSVRSDEGDPIKHPVSYIERKIAEFESDLFDRLKGQIQRECRFHIVVSRLEMGGYCAECRSSE